MENTIIVIHNAIYKLSRFDLSHSVDLFRNWNRYPQSHLYTLKFLLLSALMICSVIGILILNAIFTPSRFDLSHSVDMFRNWNRYPQRHLHNLTLESLSSTPSSHSHSSTSLTLLICSVVGIVILHAIFTLSQFDLSHSVDMFRSWNRYPHAIFTLSRFDLSHSVDMFRNWNRYPQRHLHNLTQPLVTSDGRPLTPRQVKSPPKSLTLPPSAVCHSVVVSEGVTPVDSVSESPRNAVGACRPRAAFFVPIHHISAAGPSVCCY
ncbi:hypothetical protein J6590_034917 [Homalodisca vitripennis]|nr:hypothetical protein J6590_034917 [Homalodisca vitripennis]